MEPELLVKIVENIKSVRIAVVGDFCLDAYLFIDDTANEISIETGLTTRPVRRQRYSLGGAGNLANNLASLGVKDVKAFGVVGNDLYGREMLRIMDKASINTTGIFVQEENWSTHVYCKPHAGDEEQNRLDFGNFNLLDEHIADQIIDALLRENQEIDVIVINQQVPSGIHTGYFMQKLGDFISRHPDKTIVSDIRDKTRIYAGTCLKINDYEAASLGGIEILFRAHVPYEDTCKAAEIIFEKHGKPVFVTRGSRGSIVVDSSGIFKIPGLMHFGRIDPVGAGDSYLAGAAATLAAGYSAAISAEIGSYVAGVTVRKVFQTGTATPAELLQIGSDPNYIYEPELAEDIRMAVYLDQTEIEMINNWPKDLQITHAIFDHDGTISTLREGWEPIMASMMIKAVMGEKYESADRKLYDKVRETVNELIENTTGLQTLAQMDALVHLVQDFGMVPEQDILDRHGYKTIYNQELIRLVRQREEKLSSGELSVDDFTIKNAVYIIEALCNAGIKLYLASGTDQKDVENEARLLGYDSFFDGGILGAVGDIKKDAKKMVLENILKTIGASGYGRILTVGDGPVEIRETRKAGGRTIAVASNEIRRFGLNEKKRTRLIKAGADIIVPDFSQADRLLKLLNL
jgi:rfaE bifunctional protein kinase chain/domain